MKERPLLMSGPLVLATLAGHKTQTRRLPRPGGFGEPGDRLWVRETWAYDLNVDREPTLIPWIREQAIHGNRRINYRADEATFGPMQTGCGGGSGRWRPSIHMPRWASRLTLEILEVRTEPLHAITEADATQEGLPRNWDESPGWVGSEHGWLTPAGYLADPDACDDAETVPLRGGGRTPATVFTAREAFRSWWIHLHGAESWASNPEVTVITCRVLP